MSRFFAQLKSKPRIQLGTMGSKPGTNGNPNGFRNIIKKYNKNTYDKMLQHYINGGNFNKSWNNGKKKAWNEVNSIAHTVGPPFKQSYRLLRMASRNKKPKENEQMIKAYKGNKIQFQEMYEGHFQHR